MSGLGRTSVFRNCGCEGYGIRISARLCACVVVSKFVFCMLITTKTGAFGHTTGVGVTSRAMLDNGLDRLSGWLGLDWGPNPGDGRWFDLWILPNTVEGIHFAAAETVTEF